MVRLTGSEKDVPLLLARTATWLVPIGQSSAFPGETPQPPVHARRETPHPVASPNPSAAPFKAAPVSDVAATDSVAEVGAVGSVLVNASKTSARPNPNVLSGNGASIAAAFFTMRSR